VVLFAIFFAGQFKAYFIAPLFLDKNQSSGPFFLQIRRTNLAFSLLQHNLFNAPVCPSDLSYGTKVKKKEKNN